MNELALLKLAQELGAALVNKVILETQLQEAVDERENLRKQLLQTQVERDNLQAQADAAKPPRPLLKDKAA